MYYTDWQWLQISKWAHHLKLSVLIETLQPYLSSRMMRIGRHDKRAEKGRYALCDDRVFFCRPTDDMEIIVVIHSKLQCICNGGPRSPNLYHGRVVRHPFGLRYLFISNGVIKRDVKP